MKGGIAIEELLETERRKKEPWSRALGKIGAFLMLFYLFLVSVKLMGLSLELFGHGFTESLLQLGRNPSACLFIGILGTSILQSSGAVTSMVVVWGQSGLLPLQGAIPMVMGANIGTSITNLLVSLSMITRAQEFRRAISGAIVHDFFNVMAVVIFFPLELATGFLRHSALACASSFQGAGGAELVNLMDVLVSPPADAVQNFVLNALGMGPKTAGVFLLVTAVALLFASLIFIARLMRRTVLKSLEVFFDRFLFRNAAAAILFGILLTMVVRSSSVATALVVPLVGAGVLTVEQIFPYTLGANVGTTFSAMLAALVKPGHPVPGTTIPMGLTVAFAHLLFNLFGIVLIYPFRFIPIAVAKRFGEIAAEKKSVAFIYVGVVFFVIPAVAILVSELLG